MDQIKLPTELNKKGPKFSRSYRIKNLPEYVLPIIRSYNQKRINSRGKSLDKNKLTNIQKPIYLDSCKIQSDDSKNQSEIYQNQNNVSKNNSTQKIEKDEDANQIFEKAYVYGNAFRTRKLESCIKKKAYSTVENVQQLNVTSYGKAPFRNIPSKFKSQKKHRSAHSIKKQNEQTILIKISAPLINQKISNKLKSKINWSKTIDINLNQLQKIDRIANTIFVYPLGINNSSSVKQPRKNSICPWQLNQEQFF